MAETGGTKFHGDVDSLKVRVPITKLISAENYNLELEKIFRRQWLYAGNAADIPEPNCYQVVEVPTLNASILLMRDSAGTVRAFHNVCTHRGNKLVRSGQGCKLRLNCNFHGWSFATDGKLAGIPDQTQFRELDKTLLNLPPVHSEVWCGHIFVNFAENPTHTLKEWLGDLYHQFDGYYENKPRRTSYQVDVATNWHLGMNSFSEGYHTLFLHKNTAPDYQGGSGNAMRHRPYMELTRFHTRFSAPSNPNHRETPAEAAAYKNTHKLLPSFEAKRPTLPPGVNPGRAENWAFDVMKLFPNLIIINRDYYHLMLRFWPISESRTIIQADRFFFPATKASDEMGVAYSRVRAREILREDLNTLEACQQMLSTGAITHLQLSQQELALQHHYKVVQSVLEEVA